MLWETIRLAGQTISRNLLRSFLTVLGIVIGVGAVIAMITVGQGSSRQVTADVAALGTDILVIRRGQMTMGPAGRNTGPPFSMADVKAVGELETVADAAPSASRTVTAVFGNTNLSTTAQGGTASFLDINNRAIASGRNFSDNDEQGARPVCILGETLRSAFFGAGSGVGETIRVRTLSCEVIGVLVAKGANSFGMDQDDLIVMPIRTFQRRVAGNRDVTTIYASLAEGVTTTEGISEIQGLMRERRGVRPGQADDFNVSDMKEFTNMLSGINTVLTGMLSSVAAVSLLVGGIGIMNIMLVSVTERTREIGIRLAVGAQASQVLLQFLVEAVVLSLIGGAIGVVVGLALAALASSFMAIPFAPEPMVVAVAFVFSAMVGVIFGYFPARAAARLDPIEALRHQ